MRPTDERWPVRRRRVPPRAGRTVWAVLGFMLLFVGLLVLVSHEYLLPALKDASHVSPASRRVLSAHALLICILLLLILFCGLLLTFRVGRFFFPRPTQRRTHTKYVDAWAEAGRRMSEKAGEPSENDGGDEPDGGESEGDQDET